MWLPSLSTQLPTFPPTKGRDSKILTSHPASTKSIAVTSPASPAPTIATRIQSCNYSVSLQIVTVFA